MEDCQRTKGVRDMGLLWLVNSIMVIVRMQELVQVIRKGE